MLSVRTRSQSHCDLRFAETQWLRESETRQGLKSTLAAQEARRWPLASIVPSQISRKHGERVDEAVREDARPKIST